MITQWNDSEDDALQGLPLRAQIIYLRGIRRYMNYKTGIVGGTERRISLKMLGEIAEAYHNRQPDQPNKKEVIVSIDQLKKAGLIERIEDKDYLIFFLPKADLEQSVQNNHGTTTAQPRHNHGTDYGTGELRNDAACSDNHGIGKKRRDFDTTKTTAHISSQISDNSISSSLRSEEIVVIFEHWKSVMNHPRTQIDDKRRKAIKAALKTGYSVSDLKDAVTGCSLTPWNMGENDKGQRYDGIDLIFRDADQIDRFINNSINPPMPKQKSPSDPQRSHSGLPINTTKGGNNYDRKPKISPDAWRDTNF